MPHSSIPCAIWPAGALPQRKGVLSILVLALLLATGSRVFAQGEVLIFSATGDIPYGSSEVPTLLQQIADHNSYSPSKFLVHVGDIKAGSDPCSESYYSSVATDLQEFAVPVYIIPGDNETTDCSNPSRAWTYWTRYFTDFEQNFCGTPATEHQSGRHENWAFTTKGVLCIGIDLPAPPSSVNQSVWNELLQDDADWVSSQLAAHASDVRCAVLFSQDGPGNSHQDLFFDQFRAAAADFAKPVLLLHGDDHSWKLDHPFPESNVLRLCVNNGGDEDPVQVTVTLDTNDPWQILRDPWSGNVQVYNAPPCVEAGSDVSVKLPATASLEGGATDDGDPSPGSLSLLWSMSSGPGNVSFSSPTSTATTAAFSAPGNYVLRLTADDGVLQGWDEIAVSVTGTAAGPTIAISDAQVAEGDTGSVDALFTVTLANGTGGTIAVDWSTSPGTATPDEDYGSAIGTLELSGTSDSRTIPIAVLGDLDVEPDETFFVTLTQASMGTITRAQATGTIANDDAAPPPPPPPPPPPGTLVLTAVDDTKVTSSSPGSTYGNSSTLRVKTDTDIWDSYLRFEVSGLEGRVARAILRLYCTNASDHAGFVHVVGDDYLGTTTPWTETGLQFDNAPVITGNPLNAPVSAEADTWVELDVTAAVQGDGTYCFGIDSPSGDSVYYSSKEGGQAPQLVVTTALPLASSPGRRRPQTLDAAAAKAGSPGAMGAFSMGPGTPNPTRRGTRVAYALPRATDVVLSVFDVGGRLIRRLDLGTQPAGPHRASWDGLDAAGHKPSAGVYFLRLQAGSHVEQKRIVVLR